MFWILGLSCTSGYPVDTQKSVKDFFETVKIENGFSDNLLSSSPKQAIRIAIVSQANGLKTITDSLVLRGNESKYFDINYRDNHFTVQHLSIKYADVKFLSTSVFEEDKSFDYYLYLSY